MKLGFPYLGAGEHPLVVLDLYSGEAGRPGQTQLPPQGRRRRQVARQHGGAGQRAGVPQDIVTPGPRQGVMNKAGGGRRVGKLVGFTMRRGW